MGFRLAFLNSLTPGTTMLTVSIARKSKLREPSGFRSNPSSKSERLSSNAFATADGTPQARLNLSTFGAILSRFVVGSGARRSPGAEEFQLLEPGEDPGTCTARRSLGDIRGKADAGVTKPPYRPARSRLSHTRSFRGSINGFRMA